METVNVTPTWRAIMPLLLAAIQDGTPVGRRAATEELYRLASLVDEMNAESAKEHEA